MLLLVNVNVDTPVVTVPSVIKPVPANVIDASEVSLRLAIPLATPVDVEPKAIAVLVLVCTKLVAKSPDKVVTTNAALPELESDESDVSVSVVIV